MAVLFRWKAIVPPEQICDKFEDIEGARKISYLSLKNQHTKLGKSCVAALYRTATTSKQFPDIHHIDWRCTTRKEAYNSPESLICAPHHIFL